MTQDTDSKGGWIDYKPGDPVPSGNVRIRHDNCWESTSFLPAEEWAGWVSGVIIAYLPQAPREEAEAERLAKAAPALVEALRALLLACEEADELGELHESVDGEMLDAAHAALEAAGVKL